MTKSLRDRRSLFVLVKSLESINSCFKCTFDSVSLCVHDGLLFVIFTLFCSLTKTEKKMRFSWFIIWSFINDGLPSRMALDLSLCINPWSNKWLSKWSRGDSPRVSILCCRGIKHFWYFTVHPYFFCSESLPFSCVTYIPFVSLPKSKRIRGEYHSLILLACLSLWVRQDSLCEVIIIIRIRRHWLHYHSNGFFAFFAFCFEWHSEEEQQFIIGFKERITGWSLDWNDSLSDTACAFLFHFLYRHVSTTKILLP